MKKYLVGDFLLDVFEEDGVGGVEGAGEHEVVPDQEAELVARRIEAVRFVLSTFQETLTLII